MSVTRREIALVVAAWAGVLSGAAVGMKTLPGAPLQATTQASGGQALHTLEAPPTESALGDFSGWLDADGRVLKAPDAPLRWAVISNADGDRLTLVMVILDVVDVHMLPPTSLSRPGSSRALEGLDPQRLLADVDLGPTDAIWWGGMRQGEFSAQRMGLLLTRNTTDLIAPQGVDLDDPGLATYIQGTPPTDRLPFTALARLEGTMLLAVHGTAGTRPYAQALLERLGATTIAWFGDTPEREPARLYLHPSSDVDGRIMRRPARLGASPEPARGMTLGHARLVLQRSEAP